MENNPLNLSHPHSDGPRTGCIAGATAENTRAQVLVDAMEALLNQLPTGDKLNYYFAVNEIIEARKALNQWRGKEVEKKKRTNSGASG